ncbi:hypothetical protein AVEN_193592-1 [Araneus ventricosus]|uniref:Uncharacterized protein n=1 Tax=Araneus ventricosus TaxID=182803 RepID=A0A4Y2MUI0_ARAVE|nr:hypothetical protein AVEN_193592-1 [Araneus ventricosus]
MISSTNSYPKQHRRVDMLIHLSIFGSVGGRLYGKDVVRSVWRMNDDGEYVSIHEVFSMVRFSMTVAARFLQPIQIRKSIQIRRDSKKDMIIG